MAGLMPFISQIPVGRPPRRPKAQAGSPNILLIVMDDGGFGDISPYNSQVAHTPNIQILADEGTQYTRFYTPVSVCGPSRFCLHTGAYPIDHGIAVNSEVKITSVTPTIAARMQAAGYRTGISGKWHLGGNNNDYQIDPQYNPENHGYDWSYVWGQWPNVPNFNDYLYSTQKTLVNGSQFIEETDKSQPFFLMMSFPAPHYPQYPAAIDPSLNNFETEIKEIDEAIGAIIGQVKLRGQYDNTIFMFITDNGPNQHKYIDSVTGEPLSFGWGTPPDASNPDRWQIGGGLISDYPWTFKPPGYDTPAPTGQHPNRVKISDRTAKGSVYEGGIRLPLIIKWPEGISQPAENNGIHFMADIFATLDLITSGVNSSEAGKDLLTEAHTTLHFRVGGADKAATLQEGWKLRLDTGELFYVGAAMDDTTDYSNDPAHAGKVAILSALSHGDVLPPQGWGPPG